MRINIGLSTLLFLIFLTLRLTDQVDWAWYWVASPLWIGWGAAALFMLFFFLLALVAA